MPAKGDGITKRKDGHYMARYTVHTPDGPKRKTIYDRKYKEVEKKLAEARGDAARGLVFDADNLKLGEYLDRWLKVWPIQLGQPPSSATNRLSGCTYARLWATSSSRT
jgi:hypothetical protein